MCDRQDRSLLFVLVASAFALVLALPAHSQAADPIGKGKNIGIGLGDSTFTAGLTGKFYLNPPSAIQLFIGNYGHYYGRYACVGCGIGIAGDYVYEFQDLVNESSGRLFLGAGGGAAFYTYGNRYYGGSSGLAINGVFELGWHFAEFPLELVLDVRPAFSFGPFGAFWLDWGAAIRFFF